MNWTTYLGGPSQEGPGQDPHLLREVRPSHVLFPDRYERPWLALMARHAARFAFVAVARPGFTVVRVDTTDPEWFSEDPSQWVAGPTGWDVLIHPSDLDRVGAARAEALRAEQPFRHRYRIRTRDGLELVEETAEPVKDVDALLWYGFVTAVSDSEVRTAAEPPAAAGMEEFAWEVLSHDLRAPLGTSLRIVETLLRRLESGHRVDDAVVEEALEAILRTLNRAESITGQILDFAAASAHIEDQYEVQDLAELVTDECSQFTHLTIDLEAHLVQARVIPPLVRRAVSNLVENAERFSPPGSTIHVTVESRDDGAVISVADEGPGVPAELKEHLFEPFVRGPGAVAGGVGLGLAVVQRIAELHGGAVAVRDREASGAEFEIVLPR